MNLTQTVVNRPIAVVIIFALFIGLAAFLVPSIPVELFPDMEMPVVMVSTTYDGAGPEDVKQNVTEVLEKQLSNVSDLDSITSTSSEGSSLINLSFDYSKDLDDATNDIRDKLDVVEDYLPDDASSPVIYKMSSDDMPIMTLGLEGDLSQNELRAIADDKVQALIERIGGISSVSINGGQDEIVHVEVSQNRLEAYNMPLTEVASALDNQNHQIGSGNIQEGQTDYLIRTDAEFASLDEIAEVVISDNVLLKDLAGISLGNEEEEDRLYVNGQFGVTLSVTKESDANSIEVSNEINAALDSINSELPDGVKLIILSDDSDQISSIMNQTYISLIEGILLAMVVLFFFLRTWSSTLIIALSIPISIFITVLFMYFAGLSMNLMTLTGLILGLGMVVDCSIVVQENIFRYRERGTKLKASAILGSREMMGSITASTLTTICVFVPIILFSDGLEGLGTMLKSLSYTIAIALIVSLIVALTFVPTMSANYLKVFTRKQKPIRNKRLALIDSSFEQGFVKLDSNYKKVLYRLLNHKWKVVLFVTLIFILSAMQFAQMGMNFAPNMSDDSLTVSLELPNGTPLDETEQNTFQLVSIIEEIGGYNDMIVTIGESSHFSSSTYSNKSTVEMIFPDAVDQTVTVAEMKVLLRQHFNDFPGATLEFTSRGPGMGNDNPVDIMVKSDDLDAAVAFADELKEALEDNLPGITEPVTDMDEGLPQLEVVIDRERAYDLGLDMYTVASEIAAGINGTTATTYRVDGEELDVELILKDKDKSSVPDLNKIFVVNSSGTRIAVSNIAELKKSSSPVSINREDETIVVHVTAGLVDGYSSTEAQADIQNLLDTQIVVPDGISYSLSGDFEDIANMGSQFIMIGIIALLLVFGIMAAQFESLKDPFIIFFTIPLMLIGVIWFYVLSPYTFSMMSAVGLVVLVGLVVNSGIVLVDYTNLLLKRGYTLRDACVEAAGNRLRPILMSAATTILGMFPLAFLGGAGTEQVQPIAQTIIGGLLVSTLMTLFVTPLLFAALNRRKYA
ncbi:MAG: efflux RND transporter permease subunit [Spirochaetales bacterium]|uniref:Efflux RND transporter permease subunit n=1 Tax=Candidatus Thalassospirochaeta sargassi TaxID=3119039 RepID=A0AAJ1MKC8_9SPIO|nr:efflux RND transporter permease subunit [Spirochaetales bacterium]